MVKPTYSKSYWMYFIILSIAIGANSLTTLQEFYLFFTLLGLISFKILCFKPTLSITLSKNLLTAKLAKNNRVGTLMIYVIYIVIFLSIYLKAFLLSFIFLCILLLLFYDSMAITINKKSKTILVICDGLLSIPAKEFQTDRFSKFVIKKFFFLNESISIKTQSSIVPLNFCNLSSQSIAYLFEEINNFLDNDEKGLDEYKVSFSRGLSKKTVDKITITDS